MNKRQSNIIAVLLALAVFVSCKQEEYLPPNWNYDIPQTALKTQTQIGAFYINRTDSEWKSAQGYTPLLNIVRDEENDTEDIIPYISTSDGVLTQQCAWADQAGIDFFVFAYNGGSSDLNLISAFEYYRTETTNVKIVINYNFSHLKFADTLIGEGAEFDSVVDDFKALCGTLFSKEYYYRMPDGRPIIIIAGNNSTNYDYSLFIPAFREAMAEYTAELQEQDESVPDNWLDFYIIGEVTTNWVAPQINEESSRELNANYCKQWYPTSYYERWYCFYPFTDIAWQNWRDYAAGWGNDFVPCIYPEYYTTASGSRPIERSTKGWTDFCNVGKRNMGSQNIILINSWNDFSNDSALEPATEYGTEYLETARKQLKKR